MLKIIFLTATCLGLVTATNFQKLFGEIFGIDFPPNSKQLNKNIIAEAMLETTQLIALNGYPAENHTVETSDGYILRVHRIPCGKNCNYSSRELRRPPVLIGHGIGCSSAIWVDNLADSLGYILADDGFDVWLGNFRPAHTSHKKYSPKSLNFWDFNSDDYGLRDLRATIDYVLRATASEKILYIGQSQGTTAIFQLLSTFTEYNDKLAGFVVLNPVGSYLYTPISPPRLAKYDALVWGLVPSGLGLPYFVLKKQIADLIFNICPASNSIFCIVAYGLLNGFETTHVNKTRLPIYFHHCSYLTSAKTMIQLAQNVHFKKFQKFDYGRKKNLELYGTELPPEYMFEKITAPAALFSTPNDPLADPLDVAIISRRLPNIVHKELIPIPTLNHAQLVELPDAKDVVFGTVANVLHKMWNASSPL